MHINLDEKQLEILETILNRLIKTFEELTKSIERLSEEIKKQG